MGQPGSLELQAGAIPSGIAEGPPRGNNPWAVNSIFTVGMLASVIIGRALAMGPAATVMRTKIPTKGAQEVFLNLEQHMCNHVPFENENRTVDKILVLIFEFSLFFLKKVHINRNGNVYINMGNTGRIVHETR